MDTNYCNSPTLPLNDLWNTSADANTDKINQLKNENEKLKIGNELLKNNNLELSRTVQACNLKIDSKSNELFALQSQVHLLNMQLNWTREWVHKSNSTIASASEKCESMIGSVTNISTLITLSLSELKKANERGLLHSNTDSEDLTAISDDNKHCHKVEDNLKNILAHLIHLTSIFHEMKNEFENYFSNTSQRWEDSLVSSRPSDQDVETSPENENERIHREELRFQNVNIRVHCNNPPDRTDISENSLDLQCDTHLVIPSEMTSPEESQHFCSTILEDSAEGRDSLVSLRNVAIGNNSTRLSCASSSISDVMVENVTSHLLTNITTRKQKTEGKDCYRLNNEDLGEDNIITSRPSTSVQSAVNVSEPLTIETQSVHKDCTFSEDNTLKHGVVERLKQQETTEERQEASKKVDAKESSVEGGETKETISQRRKGERKLKQPDSITSRQEATKSFDEGVETKGNISQRRKGERKLKQPDTITSRQKLSKKVDAPEVKSSDEGNLNVLILLEEETKGNKSRRRDGENKMKQPDSVTFSEDGAIDSDEPLSEIKKKEYQPTEGRPKRLKIKKTKTNDAYAKRYSSTSESDEAVIHSEEDCPRSGGMASRGRRRQNKQCKQQDTSKSKTRQENKLQIKEKEQSAGSNAVQSQGSTSRMRDANKTRVNTESSAEEQSSDTQRHRRAVPIVSYIPPSLLKKLRRD